MLRRFEELSEREQAAMLKEEQHVLWQKLQAMPVLWSREAAEQQPVKHRNPTVEIITINLN
ncbi:MAG: hypothetical protein KF832_02630 [Caldilineaceae bacterium]|nr:hypothetical protein [Caldilineaceae bacterium]